MPIIRLEAQISTEDLLQAVGQMPQAELDTFVKSVLMIRAQRQVSSLSDREAELLLHINQGIPTEVQSRFDRLIEKRQDLSLTETERAELIELTDRIENLDADRIEHLTQLAQLRGRSLSEVMQELGIQSPACV